MEEIYADDEEKSSTQQELEGENEENGENLEMKMEEKPSKVTEEGLLKNFIWGIT